MNILSDTSGEFTFLNKEGQKVTFTDWNQISEDFEFLHVMCFLPNIPPPPHTVQQHMEIGEWDSRLNNLLERERNASSH